MLGLRCWQVFTADQRHDLVGGRVQATGIVVLLEARRDGRLDDLAGCQVGYRAFERLGRGNADFAVIFCHHQQQAVTDVLPANFPAVADALGVSRDVFGLGAGDQQHRHLGAARLLESRQLGLKRPLLRRTQRAGAVHDMAGERRHWLQALCPRGLADPGQTESQQQDGCQLGPTLHPLKPQLRQDRR